MTVRAGWLLAAGVVAMVLSPQVASGWEQRLERDSPRNAVATCLRSAGAAGTLGLLGPLGRHVSSYDVLETDPTGFRLRARLRPGILDDCPAIASNENGTTVVAGVVRRGRSAGRVVASAADGHGGFSAPLTLGGTGNPIEPVTAAVSVRGDVLVAWADTRGQRNGKARIMVSRRPPGGRFGVRQAISPWRRRGTYSSLRLAAAMDARGAATVAWARSIPDRPSVQDLSRVETASSAAATSFGPPVPLGRVAQDVNELVLRVAPDGRALLAYDAVERLRLFERAPGAGRFHVLTAPSGGDFAVAPALALRDDGAAVLAWRTGSSQGDDGGVQVATRGTAGGFSAAQTVVKAPSASSTADLIAFGRGLFPPLDMENVRLRTVLAPDGRWALVWGSERRPRFGDSPMAPRVVEGGPDATLSPPRALGCPCRDANGVAALVALGHVAAAFTDNSTDGSLGHDLEIPSGSGRLHLALPGLRSRPRAPRLEVAAHRQVLRWGQALDLRVRCDRACDVRGVVPRLKKRHRGRFLESGPAGLGTAVLHGPGTTHLRLNPSAFTQLAPRRPGAVRAVVRAYAPDSTAFSIRSIRVFLRRRPLKPVFAPLDVRAVRRGRRLDVSWRYPRHAERVSFEVEARRPTHRQSYVRRFFASVEGGGRRRFHTRLHLRRRDVVPFVAVTASADHPPDRHKTVVVPVFGLGR